MTERVEVTEELTARDELEEIADAYREADELEKGGKALKTDLRPAILELMTEVVREELPLATRTEVVGDDELERMGGDYETWRANNFPEWRIVGIVPESANQQARVSLEENETIKKFAFEANGFKFGRTFKMVGGYFRSEDFKTEVAKRDDLGIGRPLLAKLLDTVKVEMQPVYTFDEDAAISLMGEHPELQAIFQEYTVPGTPQVSLLPIKAVKETDG